MEMLKYAVILLLVTYISVSEPRPLLLPPNLRELPERSEDVKKGRELAEFKSEDMKDPLDPTWHDPHHNDMNP